MPNWLREWLSCGNLVAVAGNNGNNPALHFGRQVRKERCARGWSIHELARRSGIDAGHLSRIENGKRPPTEELAAAIDGVFPERRGWFGEYHRDSQSWAPPGYRNWAEYETAATSMRVWVGGVLHGLVQTPEYARAHLETVPGVPAEVVTTRLAARLERQQRVLHRDNPPATWMLVDELALCREVGSAEIMAAQMDHLLAVSGLPDVTVQVVPAVAHAATASELIVTDAAAYAEHVAGGYVYTEPEIVTSLGRLITTIQVESYRASESKQLIERVRAIWASGEHPLSVLLKVDPA